MPKTLPTRAAFAKRHVLTGRPRVQTKWVWGRHERLRWGVFAVKFGIFLGLPWLVVGGSPAVLFDIPNRRYHLFGATFWPQDFYMLGLFLALAAIMLFFSTTLVARSWCGFACPQTLLTHLFMQVDAFVEGDRPARLALDGHRAKPAQVARRVLKHAIWLVIAAGLGFTSTSYFVGARELARQALAGHVGMAPALAWAAVTGLVYLFAGHLRDWICTTTCPYGRFQGAMQDQDSLVVTYDHVRGEPRGKTKATIERGGCVDCQQCVTACPMGIDIRKGPQYECISCMRCLDACDAMMGALGQPGGLVRLASAREMAARELEPTAPLPPRGVRHWLRPRVLWYGVVLGTLVAVLGTSLVTRPLVGLDAQRDPGRVYTLAGGRAGNLYHLELTNKDGRARALRVRLAGLDASAVGLDTPVTAGPGERLAIAASVLARSQPGAPRPFRFELVDAEDGRVLAAAGATFVEPTP